MTITLEVNNKGLARLLASLRHSSNDVGGKLRIFKIQNHPIEPESWEAGAINIMVNTKEAYQDMIAQLEGQL